jgi:hypothetical protein
MNTKLPIASKKSSAPATLIAAFLRRANGVTAVSVYGHLDEWAMDVVFHGAKYYLDKQLGEVQSFAMTGDVPDSDKREFALIVQQIPTGFFDGLLTLLGRHPRSLK